MKDVFYDKKFSFLSLLKLPILRGPLKGYKWVVGSCGKLLRFLTSTYEYGLTKCFERMLKKGDIVYDIGAHVGYFTLLASVLVGDEGKVIAFEPSLRNFLFLKKHIKINKLKNVICLNVAVSNKSAKSFFKKGYGI